ncbi:MAG: hypothetical protein V4772_05825, partial [Pseudomonadota bacterium]
MDKFVDDPRKNTSKPYSMRAGGPCSIFKHSGNVLKFRAKMAGTTKLSLRNVDKFVDEPSTSPSKPYSMRV